MLAPLRLEAFSALQCFLPKPADMVAIRLVKFPQCHRQPLHLPVSVPENHEHDAQQQADNHIAPKRPHPQAKAMHNHISANERDVFVIARQPDVPAPERLQRDHRGVNGDHGAKGVAEEVEEVEGH